MSTERGHIPPSFEEIGTGRATETKAKYPNFHRDSHADEFLGSGETRNSAVNIQGKTRQELRNAFRGQLGSGNAPATRNFNPERLSVAPKREGTTNLGGNREFDINNLENMPLAIATLEHETEHRYEIAENREGEINLGRNKESDVNNLENMPLAIATLEHETEHRYENTDHRYEISKDDALKRSSEALKRIKGTKKDVSSHTLSSLKSRGNGR